MQYEAQEKLHDIHERLDSTNSINSVGKSFDQTLEQVRQAVAKLHSTVTQSDLRAKQGAEASASELRDLQALNAAQAERIRALTIAADARVASCEDSEALIEEIA